MLKVGDLVSIIDEDHQGVITSLGPGDVVLVADDDGFELEYSQKDLIKIEESHHEDYDRSVETSGHGKDKVHRKLNPVRHKKDVVEVDLHIEELVDDHRGWSNADILLYQLDKFEKVLSAAFQTRKRKMVVIHGRGDGVLRHEIRRKLQDYPGIEIHDASYKNYGQGATEILLHK
jgi:dsDNA-specific endonuclease/ATPase MutS2